MQTEEFFGNFFCSQQLNQGLDNGRIAFSVINILLSIAAIVGNTVILIALHKDTSLHQPSKVLLRNLVASDLFSVLVRSPFCKDGGKLVAFSISSLEYQEPFR